jgi:hypothetical protein
VVDTPDGFVSDLLELSLIPADKLAAAKRFFKGFFAEVSSGNRVLVERMYATSLLPSYTGANTMIDMRAIIQQPFGSLVGEAIETYKPKCVGFVPVVIVKIRRDDGTPADFEFQCEEAPLRRLVNILEAALVDLRTAKASLPKGK